MSERKKGYSRGFTLIEFMVLVAIIGIIASIAIPYYIEYTRCQSYDRFEVFVGFPDGYPKNLREIPFDANKRQQNNPSELFLRDCDRCGSNSQGGKVRVYKLTDPKTITCKEFEEL